MHTAPLLLFIAAGTLVGDPIDTEPLSDAERDRQTAAIAQLEKWNAEVHYVPMKTVVGRRVVEKPIEVAVFDDWKGGDDGLERLAELPDLQRVHLIGKVPVTEPAVTRLKKALPDVQVARRPAVFLGVGLTPTPPGLFVGVVRPRSSAHEAGILAGDVLETVDGREVEKFEDVFDALQSAEIGDEIDVVILRDETKRMTIRVKLQGWK